MMEKQFDMNGQMKQFVVQFTELVGKRNPRSIPQHLIVTGQAGYGKSSFLKELENRLQSELNCRIVFSSYPYHKAQDMEFILRGYEDRKSMPDVLLIDDFDLFLKEISQDEQYRLRAYLYQKGAPMLIGTTTGIPVEFVDYRAPFYDAFRIFYLDGMDSAGLSGYLKALYPDVTVYPFKAEDLCRFLGGNLHYLKVALPPAGLPQSLEECLLPVQEKYGPYFRLQLDSLAKLQQMTLIGMAVSPRAVSLSELRELTGQENSRLTSSLSRLEEKQLIRKTGQGGRNNRYAIPDRMFHLWIYRLYHPKIPWDKLTGEFLAKT